MLWFMEKNELVTTLLKGSLKMFKTCSGQRIKKLRQFPHSFFLLPSTQHSSLHHHHGQDCPLCAEYVPDTLSNHLQSLMENPHCSTLRNADIVSFHLLESNCNATTVAVFGAIGAAVVAFKALSFLKVLVDVFLRSGLNVSPPVPAHS